MHVKQDVIWQVPIHEGHLPLVRFSEAWSATAHPSEHCKINNPDIII